MFAEETALSFRRRYSDWMDRPFASTQQAAAEDVEGSSERSFVVLLTPLGLHHVNTSPTT